MDHPYMLKKCVCIWTVPCNQNNPLDIIIQATAADEPSGKTAADPTHWLRVFNIMAMPEKNNHDQKH